MKKKNQDNSRKIFINFLKKSIAILDDVLERVERKYPDLFTKTKKG